MKRDNATDNSSAPPSAAGLVTKRSDLGFPVVLIAVFLLLELGGVSVREALRYEHDFFVTGEWWRVVSGHFVHLGWSHVVMNAVGLAVMVWVFSENVLRDGMLLLWWLPTGIAVIAISLLFMQFAPGLHWYVGFSGVLHSLVVVALFRCRAYWPAANWWLLVAALTAKLLYEYWFGALPGSEGTAGGPVAVQAHIAGAVVGLLYGSIWFVVGYVTGYGTGKSKTKI